MTIIKLLKNLIFIPIFLILLGFYTLLLYFNVINSNDLLFKIVNYIFSLSIVFVFSTTILRNKSKKGLLNGLIFGVFYCLVLIIVCLIKKIELNLPLMIKCISILFISMLGGIISVNKKSRC